MHILRKSNYPQKIHNPDGEIIQEIIGAQAGGIQSHSLAKITLPAGKSSEPHFHKVSEESYFILAGTSAITVDGISTELRPGDAILIEPFETHQISNQSDADLVFLAVCVPAWQIEDSFENK